MSNMGNRETGVNERAFTPRGKRTPGPKELETLLRRGLTQQQIAEHWEEKTGVPVTRSAIAMAMRRYGLKSARPRPRYEDMLPWTVSVEHLYHYDARMLRLEGRRRQGGKLTAREKQLLTSWRRKLEEADAVVAYDPATDEGFYWLVRAPEDDDVIRRPREPEIGVME